MKLIHLLKESTEDMLEQMLERIRAECQPFLDEAREPLYRGAGYLDNPKTPTLDNMLNQSYIRKDRKARDNKQEFNDFIDAITKDAIGFKMRSEGLFTTTSYSVAEHYGDVGLVFPIGDFQFAYSPLVQDLYFTFFDQGTEEWNDELDAIMTPYIVKHIGRDLEEGPGYEFSRITRDEQQEIVKSAIQDNIEVFFSTKHLGAAQIGSAGHEIIITNDTGYYIVSEAALKKHFEISGQEFYEML